MIEASDTYFKKFLKYTYEYKRKAIIIEIEVDP